MPHIIIEYTANVEADARITELMRVLSDVLIQHADVFPPGGVRTRALRLEQYRMADGAGDGAFIHVAFRIKAGRPKAVTGPICAELFGALRAHLADVFARRYLGLTLELTEFDTHGFHVENNMHSRFAVEETGCADTAGQVVTLPSPSYSKRRPPPRLREPKYRHRRT